MTHPDTPELDNITIDFIYESYQKIHGDSYEHQKNLVTLHLDDQAKASLTRLLAKRELEGLIEELDKLHDWAFKAFEPNSKSATVLYEIDDRLAELREELARYE